MKEKGATSVSEEWCHDGTRSQSVCTHAGTPSIRGALLTITGNAQYA